MIILNCTGIYLISLPALYDRQTDRRNFILFVELTTYKVFHIIQIIVSEGGITTTWFDTGPLVSCLHSWGERTVIQVLLAILSNFKHRHDTDMVSQGK